MQNNWNNNIKPREKLLTQGAEKLSDTELLAIFLRVGTKGVPVMQLARNMLQHFGDLHGVIQSSEQNFNRIKGLGTSKYVQLQAAYELVRRSIAQELIQNPSFNNPELVKRYLLLHFEQTDFERFACLFLNSQNRLIRFDYLFNGSINSAQVYPRTIAQQCLKLNAAAIIFAHNHPSGETRPSQADLNLTKKLIQTLELIDVKVLDHFIIACNNCFSMAQHKLL